MPTLEDFGGPSFEWPLVERKAMVHLTYDGERRMVGFVGREQHRGLKVYTTRRTKNHYYHNGEGYAISDRALHRANGAGVTHVLIHQHHVGHVYEYALGQYLDFGSRVPQAFVEDENDRQTYVQKSRHQFRYPNHADDMFARSFEEACAYIKRRRA